MKRTYHAMNGTDQTSYETQLHNHRGLKPENEIGLPTLISSKSGDSFYCDEAYKLPNGNIVAYLVDEDDNGMKEVHGGPEKNLITVSPLKPPFGKPNMALWINGNEGPCLEIPNRMGAFLGDVYLAYKKSKATAMTCPSDIHPQDYVNGELSQWTHDSSFRLVNYGIVPVLATKSATKTVEEDLYAEGGDFHDTFENEKTEKSEVWVSVLWYEFQPIGI